MENALFDALAQIVADVKSCSNNDETAEVLKKYDMPLQCHLLKPSLR